MQTFALTVCKRDLTFLQFNITAALMRTVIEPSHIVFQIAKPCMGEITLERSL